MILSPPAGGLYSVACNCLYLLGHTEYVPPEDGDRIKSQEYNVLNRKPDDE
jgi:hypothetical protein